MDVVREHDHRTEAEQQALVLRASRKQPEVRFLLRGGPGERIGEYGGSLYHLYVTPILDLADNKEKVLDAPRSVVVKMAAIVRDFKVKVRRRSRWQRFWEWAGLLQPQFCTNIIEARGVIKWRRSVDPMYGSIVHEVAYDGLDGSRPDLVEIEP